MSTPARARDQPAAAEEETVKTYMKNVPTKLSAKDRTHAVVVAVRRGIIDI